MGRFFLVLSLAATVACARGSGGQTGDAAPDTHAPIDAAIDGNGCASQPCTILPQCGCGQTSACDVDTTDSVGTACRPVNVPGRETASCSGLDRCDKEYVCLGGATYATCKKYCIADGDCGTPRGRCAIDISANGTAIAGIPSACSSNCNPLPTTPPAECPANYKCSLFTATHNAAPVKITDCNPAGSGTQGAACGTTSGNDSLCAPGYMCTTLGSNFQCRRICNKSAGNTGCAGIGVGTCLGFTTPHTVDVEYGVCQ
ncbi:MAG TPA: hypothetical protein VIV40_27605 [Kofleriaceae bacterium]